MTPSTLRRPDLHAKAARVAQAVCAKFGAGMSTDMRSVLSYWLSSEIAFERAAQNLISYAAAIGITDSDGPEAAPVPVPTTPEVSK